MKLNAKSEYALRAMLDLARRPAEQTTLDEVAERQKIPHALLRNIVQSLTRAGLVETVRGYGGGVRLGKPAEQINIQMVIEAMEGPLRFDRCGSAADACPVDSSADCALHAVWEKTQQSMLEVWQEYSLADLVKPNTTARPQPAAKTKLAR